MWHQQKHSYFWYYSEKCERALKGKRYREVLALAINAYQASKDLGHKAFETASLAYAVKAIEGLDEELRGQRIELAKKKPLCSFCGLDQSETRLMAGADANICEACAARIYRFFETELRKPKKKSRPKSA